MAGGSRRSRTSNIVLLHTICMPDVWYSPGGEKKVIGMLLEQITFCYNPRCRQVYAGIMYSVISYGQAKSCQDSKEGE